MPSFLNKVFGKKKDERLPSSPTTQSNKNATKRYSNASLLEGKYEAVSPSVSPSAAKFSEATHQNKDKDGGPLSLLRTRSKNPTEQLRPNSVTSMPPPHLTLNLPVPKEERSRALGVVFEADPDNIGTLPDTALGERRLSPLEALLLVKACSEAIIKQGGLDVPGLMHPHWYAASPDAQRKLISLYIQSLGQRVQTLASTLTPIPTTLAGLFATELEYTRSPHDIAAALRWAIRHLSLEGSDFGKVAEDAEWAWYVEFAKKERDSGYAPTAFSHHLAPLLPAAHMQLLSATLDIISSLAAHGERTGASGSKLSMLFGLWLLAAERTQTNDNWAEFYKRWERAGRILEHIFLAHVREESLTNKIPLRLSELVKQYPYSGQQATSPDVDEIPFLPRPRFSTRRFDALFVRVDTQLGFNAKRPARDHPMHLIFHALQAVSAPDATFIDEASTIWEDIKKRASEDTQETDTQPVLTRVLDDEALRILSLIPADPSVKAVTPTSSMESGSTTTPIIRLPQPQRRSSSAGPGTSNGKATGRTVDSASSSLFTNWNDFSVVGFGETLVSTDFAATLDTDVEVTTPSTPPSSRELKKQWNTSPPRRGNRLSMGDAAASPNEQRGRDGGLQEAKDALLTRVDIVQIDEAFVDFWSDSFLDPISSTWPSFIVCQLKPGVWKVNLLLIEHSYSHPPLPPPPPIPAAQSDRRTASPRPSVSSNGAAKKGFTFSPTKKRFTFFTAQGRSSADAAGKKGDRIPVGTSPRLGEMGEMLPEEPAPAAVPQSKPKESELPPIPVVPATPTTAVRDLLPSSIEPVKIADNSADKPTANIPSATFMPLDEAASHSEEKALPPAPEEVAVAGSTPGPQVALSSSEPAALAHAFVSEPTGATSGTEEVVAPPEHVEDSVPQSSIRSDNAPVELNPQTVPSISPAELKSRDEDEPQPLSGPGEAPPPGYAEEHAEAHAPAVAEGQEIEQDSAPLSEDASTVAAAGADPTPSPSNSEDTAVGSEPDAATQSAQPTEPIAPDQADDIPEAPLDPPQSASQPNLPLQHEITPPIGEDEVVERDPDEHEGGGKAAARQENGGGKAPEEPRVEADAAVEVKDTGVEDTTEPREDKDEENGRDIAAVTAPAQATAGTLEASSNYADNTSQQSAAS